jgi:hypothetical protein
VVAPRWLLAGTEPSCGIGSRSSSRSSSPRTAASLRAAAPSCAASPRAALVFGWRREPSKLGYCYLLQNPALNAALSPAAVPAASPATLLRATRDPIPKRLSAAQGRGLVAPRWLPAEADPPQGVGSTARPPLCVSLSRPPTLHRHGGGMRACAFRWRCQRLMPGIRKRCVKAKGIH